MNTTSSLKFLRACLRIRVIDRDDLDLALLFPITFSGVSFDSIAVSLASRLESSCHVGVGFGVGVGVGVGVIWSDFQSLLWAAGRAA